MRNKPRNFLLTPYCYVDSRIITLKDVFQKLRKYIDPNTVYKVHSLVDYDFDWGVQLIHPRLGDAENYVVFTVPLAYIKPRDLNKKNMLSWLSVSHFCPWCNENHLKVIHRGLKCDKGNHIFIVKWHKRKITVYLKLKDNSFELKAEIDKSGQLVETYRYDNVLQPLARTSNYIEILDKIHKMSWCL